MAERKTVSQALYKQPLSGFACKATHYISYAHSASNAISYNFLERKLAIRRGVFFVSLHRDTLSVNNGSQTTVRASFLLVLIQQRQNGQRRASSVFG